MDWKKVAKLLRLRRPAAVSAASSDDSSSTSDPALHKIKLNNLRSLFSQPLDLAGEPKPTPIAADGEEEDRRTEALDSLVADLFSAVSAIKASYAQLQLAQVPYDPDSVQAADLSIVSDLKKISDLKQLYVTDQISAPESKSKPLAAQIKENRNLVKTFKITIKKLESQLQSKDAELVALQSTLRDMEISSRALESKLHPSKTIASLDNLHLSALNPTHFLVALRSAAQSVRSFTKALTAEMRAAGWDLDAAAAAAVHRQVALKPEHRHFAFESFVSSRMFSDFHRKDFNFEFLHARSRWDRRRFWDKFDELKFLKPKEICDRDAEFGKFCKAKYLSVMHPRMEAAFFGASAGSGPNGSAGSDFFNGFMEMAKRVWLLHCLFFSFGPELGGSVFQARAGSRLSETYTESVADSGSDPYPVPTVGFTVAPGFRIGSTVIQCKVYLA